MINPKVLDELDPKLLETYKKLGSHFKNKQD